MRDHEHRSGRHACCHGPFAQIELDTVRARQRARKRARRVLHAHSCLTGTCEKLWTKTRVDTCCVAADRTCAYPQAAPLSPPFVALPATCAHMPRPREGAAVRKRGCRARRASACVCSAHSVSRALADRKCMKRTLMAVSPSSMLSGSTSGSCADIIVALALRHRRI